jgi:hypothetical protein
MRRAGIRSALAVAGLAAAAPAGAGGPLSVRTNGEPFLWSTAAPIEFRTDQGPLSDTVNESDARNRVAAMFEVWEDVPSASIAYTRVGFIQATGAFAGGDVDTAAEFNAVENDCGGGGQNPVIYDDDGSIFVAVGMDETSVIGFAGPCAIDPGLGQIVSGHAVMNGLFQDGSDDPVFDLTEDEFDATFVHEFGHFSGLDHSQINVECGFGPCGADDLAGLPTMFPFLVDEEQGTLSTDDVGWISKLYPAAGGGGFNATHGTITGTIFFTDDETHVQLVNVVARRVDAAGGADESRTTAGSGVSGNRFRLYHGNPINEPSDQPLGPFGSTDPDLIGFYEIPLPPGQYMIEVESIDPEFVAGSSVGGDDRIDMPGTAPPPVGPVTVTAGQASAGSDVSLIGTPPRFDQFEGPGP